MSIFHCRQTVHVLSDAQTMWDMHHALDFQAEVASDKELLATLYVEGSLGHASLMFIYMPGRKARHASMGISLLGKCDACQE
jgi:hypothetical protein